MAMNQQLEILALKELAHNENVECIMNDRKFYGKFLYRCTLVRLGSGKLLPISEFISNVPLQTKVREFSSTFGGKVRCEGNNINYYSNSIDIVEQCINTFRSDSKVFNVSYSLDIAKDIRLRKTHLPYHKYKYQLMLQSFWSNKNVDQTELLEFIDRYPDGLFVSNTVRRDLERNYSYNPSLYALDEQMLHLAQLSLGPKVSKVVQFKLVEDVKHAE